jgi:hypothetical protein
MGWLSADVDGSHHHRREMLPSVNKTARRRR